jgi:biotin carboxylase
VARVLLLLPTTSYRTADFLEASRRLGVEVTVAAEESSTMEALRPTDLLTLDFSDPEACARRAGEFARQVRLDAVVGVDEQTATAAAAIAAGLGLPHNAVSAVRAAGNKARMRKLLSAAGAPAPSYRLFRAGEDPAAAAAEVAYPCVLKPTFLAGSRGVIRADDPVSFREAWRRIGRILAEPDVRRRGGEAADEILVEEFVPGAEMALEGLLVKGRLHTLALFDKPDPLDGPFFEETLYVTPSRRSAGDRQAVLEAAVRGVRALGLTEGPVHVEARVEAGRARLIEIAARSIGGLCARTLRFGTGLSLEELILRHALGMRVDAAERQPGASGVMMIPIPRAGVLEEVGGLDAARAVPFVEEVTITAHLGQQLVPLPEGSRYLGFVFARAAEPDAAEEALRAAHRRLEFRIAS